jgi:hypothetical protein
MRLLTAQDRSPEPAGTVLHSVEARILADLTRIRPLPSVQRFAAGLGLTFLALVGIGAWRLRPLALDVISPLLCTAILFSIGLSALVLITSLVRQMTPGSRFSIRPDLLPVYVLVALGSLFTAVLPRHWEPDFWKAGWICLACGLGFFVPAAIGFWLLLRQGAILFPRMTGITTGLLAGLTGTAVLESHCPLQTAWHVMAWHLGVPVVGMAACLLLAVLATPANERR